MNKAIYFLIITIFIIGCKKEVEIVEDDMNFDNAELAIKEVYKDGNLLSRYNYDDELRIDEIINFGDDGDTTFTWDYNYLGDTITRDWLNTSNEISLQYVYYPIGPGIVRVDRVSINSGQNNTHNIYHFENNLCYYDYRESYDQNNELSEKHFSEFSGTSCNVLFTVLDENDELNRTVEYNRDDKNWYLNSARIKLLLPNKLGNTTKYTWINQPTGTVSNGSHESIFDYNSNEYPTHELRTYVNGFVEEYDFTYY